VALTPLLRPATISRSPAGGHATLGLRAYAQVTSPLRRYLDLVAHQQIRTLLGGVGGKVEGAPLEHGAFEDAAARLARAEAEGAEPQPRLPLPYSAADVGRRLAHVFARSALMERLEMSSSRYWTMQFLAQQARDGSALYDAIVLAREEHPLHGKQVLVLLEQLGLRTWLREYDCDPGTQLTVRVRKVHAHRSFISLVPA
jgi:exoribonuclease R